MAAAAAPLKLLPTGDPVQLRAMDRRVTLMHRQLTRDEDLGLWTEVAGEVRRRRPAGGQLKPIDVPAAVAVTAFDRPQTVERGLDEGPPVLEGGFINLPPQETDHGRTTDAEFRGSHGMIPPMLQ